MRRVSARRLVTPQSIVEHLDRFVVGQSAAKRVLATAIRSRWRRLQLRTNSQDICPRNILLSGPSGIGKTALAKALAKFVDAPLIKVEATKFTEVGYHGRDVDSIIKDLVTQTARREMISLQEKFEPTASLEADKLILADLLAEDSPVSDPLLLQSLDTGEFDSQMVTIKLPFRRSAMAGGALDALLDARTRVSESQATMRVDEARKALKSAILSTRIAEEKEQVSERAIKAVEQEGIVVIDEIDKLISSAAGSRKDSPDASAEGVQRDLLPLLEGTTVVTPEYGSVQTDHILFIACGAFLHVSPGDLMAELRGRLPLHVALDRLTTSDMVKILTDSKTSPIRMHQQLLSVEGVELKFTEEAIAAIAECASLMNLQQQDIGARRLHAIVET